MESPATLYQCRVCSKTFSTAPYRDQHQQKHFDSDVQPKDVEERISPRHTRSMLSPPQHRYECQVCHKSFAQKTRYQRHYQMHLKRRQHVCPLCSSEFSQQSQLAQHVWEVHRKTMTDLAFDPAVNNNREPVVIPSEMNMNSLIDKSDNKYPQRPIAEKVDGLVNGRLKRPLGFRSTKNVTLSEVTNSKPEKTDVYDFDANSDDDEILPMRAFKPRNSQRISAITPKLTPGECEGVKNGALKCNSKLLDMERTGASQINQKGVSDIDDDDEDCEDLETHDNNPEDRWSCDPGEDVDVEEEQVANFAFVENISPTGLKIKIKPLMMIAKTERKRKQSFQANLQDGLKLKIRKVSNTQKALDCGEKTIDESMEHVIGGIEDCAVEKGEFYSNEMKSHEEDGENEVKQSNERLILNMADRNLSEADRTGVNDKKGVNMLENTSENDVIHEKDINKTEHPCIEKPPERTRERICLKISKSMLVTKRPTSPVDYSEAKQPVLEEPLTNSTNNLERKPLKFSIPLSKLQAVYSTWKPVDKSTSVKKGMPSKAVGNCSSVNRRAIQAARLILVHYSRLRQRWNRHKARKASEQLSSDARETVHPNAYPEEVMSESDSAVVDMVLTPESLQKIDKQKESHSEEDQGIGMESDDTNSPGAHSESSICATMLQNNEKQSPERCHTENGGKLISPNSQENNSDSNVYRDNSKWRKTFVSLPEKKRGKSGATSCPNEWFEQTDLDCTTQNDKMTDIVPQECVTEVNDYRDSSAETKPKVEIPLECDPADSLENGGGWDLYDHKNEVAQSEPVENLEPTEQEEGVSSRIRSRRSTNGKNTAQDWLVSLNNHDKTTKSKQTPTKTEEPLINLWQNMSGSGSLRESNSSDTFQNTFGAFATKTNRFQSFADLSQPILTDSFCRSAGSDSASDFEDFEPPALKVPVKTLLRTNSDKRPSTTKSQNVSHSDYFQQIGLQRQGSNKSTTAPPFNHFENEFLKFVTTHGSCDDQEYTNVFDDDDESIDSDDGVEENATNYGSTCTCARFLSYFNRHKFVRLYEELVYLRHKICEMVLVLFPRILYCGQFDITSSDVEDLLESITEIVTDGPILTNLKLKSKSKELEIVLCKTPKHCLVSLRKRTVAFLQLLFPGVVLEEDVYLYTDALQSIMEEVISNNKHTDSIVACDS